MSEPLTDKECEELMFLYRVCRAENDKPGERERLKYLMRRFEADKAANRLDSPPASGTIEPSHAP